MVCRQSCMHMHVHTVSEMKNMSDQIRGTQVFSQV